MLYVYTGADTAKARAKVRATLETLQKRNPEALFLRVYGEEFLQQDVVELTQSQALFKSEYVVFLDSIVTNKEAEKRFTSTMQAFAESPHVFVLLQAQLAAPVRKKLEAHAKKVEVFDGAKVETTRQNPFAITDLLFAKKKAALWAQLQHELAGGRAAEEIHGVLFWAAKSIVQKKRGARLFTQHEAQHLLHALALAPSKAYRSGVPLALVLEQAILEL